MRLLVLCILSLLQGVQCIYFKRYRYTICPSSEGGQVLVDSSTCDPSSLKYSASSDILTIDIDGRISVKRPNQVLNHVTITATCSEKGESVTTNAIVDILQTCDINRIPLLKDKQSVLCFDGSDLNITITENISPSILGRLTGFSIGNSGFSRRYSVHDILPDTNVAAKYFSVDPVTSTLSLLLPLDADHNNVTKFEVTCEISHPQQKTKSISTVFVVGVKDQNDNPPIFSDGSQIMSFLLKDEKEKHVTVTDKDKVDCKQFDVEVSGDPLKICHPEPENIGWYIDNEGYMCRLAVNIIKSKVVLPDVYTCTVAFIDAGYSLPSNETRSDRVILELKWIKNSTNAVIPKNKQLQLRVNRNANKYSQIYIFPETTTKMQYVMVIPKHGFEVTLDGIVYVEDIATLRQNDVVMKTTVRAFPIHGGMKRDVQYAMYDLFISVIGQTTVLQTDQSCNKTCARFKNKSSCESNCGLGTLFESCVWRQGSGNGVVSKYSTCSPNLNTCPNNVCDSLEEAYPFLCPQDCTRRITGTGQLNKASGRGIAKGLGQCWCDYNPDCYCFNENTFVSTTPVNFVQYGNKSYTGKGTTADRNHTLNKIRVDPVLDDQMNNSDKKVCDMDCVITIATICGCICALGCLFILVWKTRRFKCHRNKALKHVGSTASMSVIPSDYMDDRDYRTTHYSPQFGPYYKESTMGSVQSPEDAKWEVDRENLQLDNTLGEGEFGKVVKAKAFNIDGKQTYTDVAVKMLKNCASNVEQQALWSEFNLLKDVQHPNVIRLLGACTQNGPTFIVVEYCEHGSLLIYLRNSRLEENGYVNQRYKSTRQFTSWQREPPELLTIRDLLSFAWQTAKGMKYLSEIKLVHRDLAARNVLVGTGKVLKISDFGLTRDVYEADTYLKQSKGRIPVKWLAPESLYAQIYTTQSDVWSFGIVLWEIITLGAPPYPGVPPERLYNLLLAGYRMDRPENCSDELYAVMQKCWKTDPQDRPTFSKLAEIFDRMLQQRTEYLELTGGFDDDTSDLFGNLYAPTVSGLSVIGRQPLPLHSEQRTIDCRNSGSSYLTPALTHTIDSVPSSSDITSVKRETNDMSEMSSLLTDTGGKNPFLTEPVMNRKAEQTVV